MYSTRKLSYRKDDALYIGYGCPEKSLSTPTATFAEIFNGLLIRSMNVPAKFEGRSFTVPEIIVIAVLGWNRLLRKQFHGRIG